jgi:hypothetical protein
MDACVESEFTPFRVVVSSPEEFVLERKELKEMSILTGMVLVVGLPFLFFGNGSISEKAFGTVMAIGFLCWIGVMLRYNAARVSVHSKSGVHIKTRGPWGGDFYLGREQIQSLQIRRTVLLRFRRDMVWAISGTGLRVPLIWFLLGPNEPDRSRARRFADELAKRIAVPISLDE